MSLRFMLIEQSAEILYVVDRALENFEIAKSRSFLRQEALEPLDQAENLAVLDQVLVEDQSGDVRLALKDHGVPPVPCRVLSGSFVVYDYDWCYDW